MLGNQIFASFLCLGKRKYIIFWYRDFQLSGKNCIMKNEKWIKFGNHGMLFQTLVFFPSISFRRNILLDEENGFKKVFTFLLIKWILFIRLNLFLLFFLRYSLVLYQDMPSQNSKYVQCVKTKTMKFHIRVIIEVKKQ